MKHFSKIQSILFLAILLLMVFVNIKFVKAGALNSVEIYADNQAKQCGYYRNSGDYRYDLPSDWKIVNYEVVMGSQNPIVKNCGIQQYTVAEKGLEGERNKWYYIVLAVRVVLFSIFLLVVTLIASRYKIFKDFNENKFIGFMVLVATLALVYYIAFGFAYSVIEKFIS